MKIFLYALVGSFILLGAGCGNESVMPVQSSTTPSTEVDQSQPLAEAPKTYSLEQVALHATSTDCWLAIDGQVFDVTRFIPDHPGKNKILFGCGKDATAMFKGIKSGQGHSDYAVELRADYFIGDLK